MRIEKDIIGEKEIPGEALYGIHSVRAKENFPADSPFHVEWYRAVGLTKLACYKTYIRFRDAAEAKYGETHSVRFIPDETMVALSESASEVAEGKFFDQFIVPGVQGGAGTSINMNINEIIANRALIRSGKSCGEYSHIDPITHANIYQSTNDIIPTALTVAAMKLLEELESEINHLREKIEKTEMESRNILRTGYTQMQPAVPTTFGILFSTYNDALSRDWWRVSKCLERLKPVNLGGGAIGTGLAVPRFFIMNVVEELRKITGLPLSHSENLSDSTANLDKWVEVHATLKTLAANLAKMASDLRLLASDLGGGLVTIPDRQVGSSIMPGKVNPVICEYIITVSQKVFSNDSLISSLSALGTLELNAYLPAIGDSFLESIKLLISACRSATSNLIEGIKIDREKSYNSLIRNASLTTALIPVIGYHKASEIALYMKEKNCDIFEANRILGIVDEIRLNKLLQPVNLIKLGYSLEDL